METTHLLINLVHNQSMIMLIVIVDVYLSMPKSEKWAPVKERKGKSWGDGQTEASAMCSVVFVIGHSVKEPTNKKNHDKFILLLRRLQLDALLQPGFVC
jgi:hypothetical protein